MNRVSEARGVICSGNIVFDTLVRPVDDLHWGGTTFVDRIEWHAGGNGCTTSRVLAILGVPVRLLGAVGKDEPARFLLERLREAGVDTARIEHVDSPTSSTVGLVRPSGERKFFHCHGASNDALANGIDFTPELGAGAAHYHMSGLFVLPRLRPLGADVLRRAHAAGLSTSFDTNWDPRGAWMSDLAPCLPEIDYLFMNEDEARMITGHTDAAKAADVVLAGGLKTAVLKLGGRGCAIYTAEREFLCPAFDVDVIDTTGAGDCFAAGFIAAMLGGANLEECGRFGNAVAALSVRQMGAASGVLSFAETEKWMNGARVRTA
jgi:sugar/nucleoside kinase (ribokinase family)